MNSPKDKENYVYYPTEIWNDKDLTVQDISVYLAMCFYHQEGNDTPSYAELKSASKIKAHQIIRKSINTLVEKGWLKVEYIKGYPNKYTVVYSRKDNLE